MIPIRLIDENLARAELTAVQRVIHLKRRKELHQLKGGKNLPTPGGLQKIGFAKDTAAKTGRSKRSINAAIALDKAIPGIERLVDTSLDKGVELDALAKLPEAEQSALIKTATAGKKVSARSPKAPKPPAAQRQERVQLSVEVVAASADDDGIDEVERAGPAADEFQDEAAVDADGDDRDSEGIAAAVEKLASDACVEPPTAKPKAAGEVEPNGAEVGYETDNRLYLALRKAFDDASPKAFSWFLKARRDVLRLQLAAEGYELLLKKPENEATDVTALDQGMEPADPSSGGAP